MTNPKSRSKTSRASGRATLTDVAHLAGVTTMTVSRFLREPVRVAPGTADSIRRALAQTGYTPNKQAGGLASGKSRMVGAVLPNVGNTLFAQTAQGLCDVLQPAGYELLLSATNYSLEREEEQVRAILGWLPAALIVTGSKHSAATLAMLRAARERGTPMVQMWDNKGPRGLTCVGFDHGLVGQRMAQHLLDCGYRDMVYVDSGVPEDFRAHERGQALVEYARQQGARASIHTAERLEPMAAGRIALQSLASQVQLRALAFANDHLAVGALLEAHDMGIAVPQRLALLGFGDFPIAAQLNGGLSSVYTDHYNIGLASAWRVLHDLAGPGTPQAAAALERAKAVQPSPRIVRRAST